MKKTSSWLWSLTRAWRKFLSSPFATGCCEKPNLPEKVGSPLPNAGEGLGVRGNSTRWLSPCRSSSGKPLRFVRTRCKSVHWFRTHRLSPSQEGEGNRVSNFLDFKGVQATVLWVLLLSVLPLRAQV